MNTVLRRYGLWTLLLAVVASLPAVLHAQDGLNLPADLYVLQNEGVVRRYGQGARGVQQVTPDDAFVVDFGVAPDDRWLAYRTPDALVLHDPVSGSNAVLDERAGFPPQRGRGDSLAWSPDARAIAYTTSAGMRVHFRGTSPTTEAVTIDVSDGFDSEGFRRLRWSPDARHLAVENALDLWVIYRIGGADASLVAITPASLDLLWTGPDTLVFAAQAGGLVTMDLASANAQTPLVTGSVTYSALASTPDGQLVAVGSTPTALQQGEGTYTLIDPATGATERPTDAQLTLGGLQWTPDGGLLVAFQGGSFALVNPTDGSGFSLPVESAVAYGWGVTLPPTREGLATGQNVFFLADDDNGIRQVWQAFAGGQVPMPITTSQTAVDGYGVAQDGTRVAYVTAGDLYVQTLNDTGAPLLLTSIGTTVTPRLSFNREGIAYDNDDGVWLAPANGGEARQIAQNDDQTLTNPRFAPSVAALLLDIDGPDGPTTGVLDIASGELQLLSPGTVNARWLPGNRVLSHAPTQPGLRAGVQVADLSNLSTPEVVLPDAVSVADVVLLPDGGYRVLLAPATGLGPSPVSVYDFRPVAGLLPVYVGSFISAPQLSNNGAAVIGYTRAAGLGEGALAVVTVTGDTLEVLSNPATVSQLRWQGR